MALSGRWQLEFVNHTLRGASDLLRKILVSVPAATTSASTHSVLRSVLPRSSRLEASRRSTGCPDSLLTVPSNSYSLRHPRTSAGLPMPAMKHYHMFCNRIIRLVGISACYSVNPLLVQLVRVHKMSSSSKTLLPTT